MTLPLVIVFLHDQRGIGLGGAGLALAAVGAGVGRHAARGRGHRPARGGWTAVGGLALAGSATAGYLFVHSTAAAVAVSAVQGAGFAATFVGLFPLLIDAVPADHRGDVLGTSYGVTNLGLDIGSTLPPCCTADPSAFTPLFVTDAITYVAFAAVLVWAGEVRRGRHRDHEVGPAGYRAVLGDRRLLVATGLNVVLVGAGYSQFTSAFPAWTTGRVGAPTSVVGLAFAANTWTIAIAQLPMLHVVRGRRRTRAIAATGLVFGVSWLITLAGGHTSNLLAAELALVGAAAVFGLGETLLSPSLPAIVQDIAEDTSRGRYVAVYSVSWQVGPMIGPAVAGAALAAGEGGHCSSGLPCAVRWSRPPRWRSNGCCRPSRTAAGRQFPEPRSHRCSASLLPAPASHRRNPTSGRGGHPAPRPERAAYADGIRVCRGASGLGVPGCSDAPVGGAPAVDLE